jgi:hypothetical protein
MASVSILKADLASKIVEHCKKLGSPDSAIYVNAVGDIDHRTSSEDNSDWMVLLSFDGMGEFADNSDQAPSCDTYDAARIAAYIVEDRNCLTMSGLILNDDGSETQYLYSLID